MRRKRYPTKQRFMFVLLLKVRCVSDDCEGDQLYEK